MAFKPCCCLSNRMGTLLFLYYYMINEVWAMLTLLTTFGDPMYKEFLKDHSYVFYTDILMAFIGGLIFLTAIISISNNKPSTSLLSAVIAFLLLEMIYVVYGTFLYTSTGVFDKLFDAEVEKQAQKLPADLQGRFRSEMKLGYNFRHNIAISVVDAMVVKSIAIVFYSIVVFYAYMTDLKGKPADVAPVRENVEDKEANFSKPNHNWLSTAPQYSTKPPQYSDQPPQYFVESNKH